MLTDKPRGREGWHGKFVSFNWIRYIDGTHLTSSALGQLAMKLQLTSIESGNNCWTGGQYSIFRFLLGTFCVLSFAGAGIRELLSSDFTSAPMLSILFFALDMFVALLAFLLALGIFDRTAALILSFPNLSTLLLGVIPLSFASLVTASTLLYQVALLPLLLLIHVTLATKPLLSLIALRSKAINFQWKIPSSLYLWICICSLIGQTIVGSERVLASLYDPSFDGGVLFYVGVAQLALMSALLCPRGLPCLWLLSLTAQLAAWCLLPQTTSTTLTLLLLHLLAGNPAWLPARPTTATETVFFDGTCGLCHRFVLFLLSEDRRNRPFQFATQQSGYFSTLLAENERPERPGVVVQQESGTLLFGVDAMLYVLRSLGGLWLLLAITLSLLPARISNWCYNALAQRRASLVSTPNTLCPEVPNELRSRFLS